LNIGLIDADLLDNGTRFPNLALMKISSYYKSKGNKTKLITYNEIPEYDKVFLSKVFDYTKIPVNLDFYSTEIIKGGTGFSYDKKDFLDDKIEHSKPDYELYSEHTEVSKYYSDHSIGFITRFCFRQCPYCVNKDKEKSVRWSEISEFDDENNSRIVLLDDNILANKDRINILKKLKETGKPFEFKQGLDFRLINEEIIRLLKESRYAGDYIFAFDNIKDKKQIVQNLEIWHKHNSKRIKFYVLTAFDRNNNYDKSFWLNDIKNTFKRIKILMENNALPYVMRYKKYKESPYRGMYINLSGWTNQPHLFKRMSFREYSLKKNPKGASQRYMETFEKKHPEISKKYFDIKWEAVSNGVDNE